MRIFKLTFLLGLLIVLFAYFSVLDARVSESKEDFSRVVDGKDMLKIPSLNTSSDIVWFVDPWDTEEYLPVISNSVAHAKQSSLPGETGTVYLFGHSSSDYEKTTPVFFNLHTIAVGDLVSIHFNEVKYDYVVRSVTLVSQNDIDYILGSKMSNGQSLAIQSCDLDPYSGKRLLVFADRVYN